MSEIVVEINELPEATTLLSTDKIYVFQPSENNDYAPKIAEVSVLSTFFHAKSIADDLRVKMNELKSLSAQFSNWLDSTYATSSYIKNHYSTKKYFNDILSEVKANSSFDSYLEEYATHDYGSAKLAEGQAEYENLKLSNTVTYSDKLVDNIKTLPEDDGIGDENVQAFLSTAMEDVQALSGLLSGW